MTITDLRSWLSAPRGKLVLALLCFGAVGSLLLANGCAPTATSGGPSQISERASEAQAGEILFDTVADNLQRLDTYVNTQLDKPVPVLTAKNTTDNQPARGIIIDNPQEPGQQFDHLLIVAQNSQFHENDVRPGDIVRYFGIRDEFGREDYVETSVAEVLNDFSLRLAQQLPGEIRIPQRVEIWRRHIGEMDRIAERLNQWAQTGEPALFWEPTPDESILVQIVERLNQWSRSAEREATWKPDPLIETLPAELRQLPQVQSLDQVAFVPEDGRLLQEAVWLRDISSRVQGSDLRELARATRLFDWVVRNIQLETRESLGGLHNRPWQTLLYGRGTAEERAWVFALLARQQGLDVVIVEPAAGESGDRTIEPVVAGLLSDGQIYLFDAALGLPIPGPNGEGVATLEQAAADDALLRQLDVDPAEPYPLEASDFEKVRVGLEASPSYLAQRMKLIEKRLAGKQSIMLSARPSDLAERIEKLPQVERVSLWSFPYETIHWQMNLTPEQRVAAVRQFYVFASEPILWKARVLHFKGIFETEDYDGAKTYYLESRPSNLTIQSLGLLPSQQDFLQTGKQNASYWLGLITFEESLAEGHGFEVAEDYFKNRVLGAYPDGIWTAGASYNLGRTNDAIALLAEARAAYESASSSRQAYGNRLRAKQLTHDAAATEAVSQAATSTDDAQSAGAESVEAAGGGATSGPDGGEPSQP